MQDKFNEAKDRFSEEGQDARDKGQELYNKGKESPAGERVEDFADSTKEKAQDAVGRAKGERRNE